MPIASASPLLRFPPANATCARQSVPGCLGARPTAVVESNPCAISKSRRTRRVHAMNPRHDRTLLKRLLDLADEIGNIRRSQRELALPPADHAALARQARERMLNVGKLLKEFAGNGPLQTLLVRYKLGKDHVLLMLELLKRRLSSEDTAMKGR